MKAFLREYWLWILVPVVLVTAGILFLIFWGKGSESDSAFRYNVF